jgi:protein-disulfide isomerase
VARPQREKTGSDVFRSPAIIALMGAVIVGGGIAAYHFSSGDTGGGGGAAQAALIPVEFEGQDDPEKVIALAKGVVFGDSTAPIKIWEFADYSCPHCRAFHETVFPRLELAYLKDKKAQLVYYDFPIGTMPNSFLASRAARCAGDQGKYREFHDVLFTNQPNWSIQTNPMTYFMDYAKGIALDEETFEGCVNSDQHAVTVSANRQLGVELNLPGTPFVLVQAPGQMWTRVRSPEFDSIAAMIDSLTAATPAAAPATPPGR